MEQVRRIDVVGAAIVRGGLVLAAQRGPERSQAGLWEFPGGKVEEGESPDAALAREIREELRCRVLVGEHLETTEHSYGSTVVVLSTYLCELAEGEPQATEHAELRWVAASDLLALDWAPADVPAVRRLIDAERAARA